MFGNFLLIPVVSCEQWGLFALCRINFHSPLVSLEEFKLQVCAKSRQAKRFASVFRGTGDFTKNGRGRNSIGNSFARDWIATMESYIPVRNPALGVGFELAKFLPEAVPLKDKLTPEFLRRLLQHHPQATLAELRDELKMEFSIKASTTALCRAFKRAGLDHNSRRQVRLTSLKVA